MDFRKLTDGGLALLGASDDLTTLTNAYGAARSGRMNVADFNKVTLYIAYTMGSAETSNSIDLKIEFSDDGSTWYRKINESDSTGTTTITNQEYTLAATVSAGSYDYFNVEINNIADRHMRVSVKETGISSNGGSCFIIANGAKE